MFTRKDNKTTATRQATKTKKPLAKEKDLISMGQTLGEIFTNLAPIFAVMIATNKEAREAISHLVRNYSCGKISITDTTNNGAK